MTTLTLSEIARVLGGEVLGDSKTRVSQVGTLGNAKATAIAFLNQDRFLHELKATRAAAVIVGMAHRDATTLPRIVCSNPHAYFARVAAMLHPIGSMSPGVHPTACVDPSASVEPGVGVGPYAVISSGTTLGAGSVIGAHCFLGEGVSLGANTRLWPGVTVYHDCAIGSRCMLHSGVVVGADGFGNALENGRWVKIPQVGRVRIGDDVEIGANTTVDRGAIEDTVIEEGVKLDNLIMIAHNVHVGAHTAIAACTGIAGSTHIGRHCRIGGAVGIAGHLTIADNVEISGKTLITKSITKAGTYSGAYPFEENLQWRRNAVQLRHLDDLVEHIKQLEKRIAQLEKNSS